MMIFKRGLRVQGNKALRSTSNSGASHIPKFRVPAVGSLRMVEDSIRLRLDGYFVLLLALTRAYIDVIGINKLLKPIMFTSPH